MSKEEWRDWIVAGLALVVFIVAAIVADRLHKVEGEVDEIGNVLDITDSAGWPPSHLDSITDAYYSDAQWWRDSIDSAIYVDMAYAFIPVESGGDSTAHNDLEDAVGPLQIRPSMLAEANRLRRKGQRAWTLEDRKSVKESVAMFVTVMMGRLEVPSLMGACVVWNPYAGESYRKDVSDEYMKRVGRES